MKTKQIDACNILNQIGFDLIIPVEAHNYFKEIGNNLNRNENVRIGINRMCLFQIIIALNKYMEFYNKYKDVIPENYQKEGKKLFCILEKKEINKFRHKFVGHIISKDTNRPLSRKEYEHFIRKIIEKKPEDFMKWIHNPDNNSFPKTVISIVETIRDQIMEINKIKKEEFIENKSL